MKRIVVFQESRNLSHIQSLIEFSKTQNYKLELYTLSLLRDTAKSFLHLGDAKLTNVLKSIIAIVRLIFLDKSGVRVIIQIAPYSRKSILAYIFNTRHEVTIYTSQYRWNLKNATYVRKRTPWTWRVLQEQCVLHGYTTPVLTNSNFRKLGHVIPHCLPDYYFFTNKNNLRLHNRTIKVGFVGRVNQYKKVNEFAEFLSMKCGLELHVVGPKKNDFKLHSQCVYRGVYRRENLLSFYDEMDIIVLPSERVRLSSNTIWEDVFGLCLLEAAARGCSLIYPNLAGPISVYSNFPSAIRLDDLYKARSPKKLIEILSDDARRGGYGNKHMAQHHTKQNIGRMWGDII